MRQWIKLSLAVVATGLFVGTAYAAVTADSDPVASVEWAEEVAPQEMGCSLSKLKKKCCPDYCGNKGKKKDEKFDACAGKIGCDEYEGRGFQICNPECK